MREEPSMLYARQKAPRITPACAGRTGTGVSRRVEKRDHPRVCGKNAEKEELIDRRKGSPPRVREELMYILQRQDWTRITPACAGRTTLPGISSHAPRDHPRVCGKNPKRAETSFSVIGSPPRVREERAPLATCSSFPGITPACAGRTELRNN